MAGEWEEVGTSSTAVEKPSTAGVITVPNPDSDPRYAEITSRLRRFHADLLKFETEGKLFDMVNNPTLVSDYLGKLRLGANQLFSFLNGYIDVHSDLITELASKRQQLFEERLATPKGTPSAAETFSKEMTRKDEALVKVVENRIQQIKNEYERFNGICMFLQSKMKENNAERIMG